MPNQSRSPHRPRTLTAVKIVAITAVLVLAGSVYSALAKTSAAPTPRPGTYQGLLGVNSISFKVSADQTKVTGLTTSFEPAADSLDCSVPPSTNVAHESFPTMRIRRGHFSGSTTVTEGATTTFSIQGHFTSPTKVTGKISGQLKVKSLPPCEATSPFSAKRKGR